MPSQIFYRGEYLHIRDGDLLTLIGFLLRAVDRLPALPWLKEARRIWSNELINGVNGMLELRLDTLLADSQIESQMLKLLDDVFREMKSYGQAIPRKILNEMLPAATFYLEDLAVEDATRLVDQVVALIIAGQMRGRDVVRSPQGQITRAISIVEESGGKRVILVCTSEPFGYLRPRTTLTLGQRIVPGTGNPESDMRNYCAANEFKLITEIGVYRENINFLWQKSKTVGLARVS